LLALAALLACWLTFAGYAAALRAHCWRFVLQSLRDCRRNLWRGWRSLPAALACWLALALPDHCRPALAGALLTI